MAAKSDRPYRSEQRYINEATQGKKMTNLMVSSGAGPSGTGKSTLLPFLIMSSNLTLMLGISPRSSMGYR